MELEGFNITYVDPNGAESELWIEAIDLNSALAEAYDWLTRRFQGHMVSAQEVKVQGKKKMILVCAPNALYFN